MALTDKIVKIADKTRKLTGLTTKMTLDEIASNMDLIKANPILQDKSIEITENGTQTITANEGYDGLNSVEVVTNVAGSGGREEPTKGIVIDEFDENGYVTKMRIVGFEVIPDYYCYDGSPNDTVYDNSNLEIRISEGVTELGKYSFNGISGNILLPNTLKKIREYAFNNSKFASINLSQDITDIEKYAFYQNSALEITELPNSLINLGQSAFEKCSKIEIKKIPDGVTIINQKALSNCDKIVQLSMKNVATIIGTSGSLGAFYSNGGMKAVWIGSTITSSGFGRYSFNSCTSLSKIFIDLPRAQVEAFTYYSTKWSNNTVASDCQIICNDDEGFMTKEQFDSIDWATYTG